MASQEEIPREISEARETILKCVRDASAALPDLRFIDEFKRDDLRLRAEIVALKGRLSRVQSCRNAYAQARERLDAAIVEHKRSQKSLARLYKPLGAAAFAAFNAGEISQHQDLFERIQLDERIERLKKELAAIGAPPDAGLLEKGKTKARQLAIAARIKREQLSIGKLDALIGRELIDSERDQLVRSATTSAILQGVASTKAEVATCDRALNLADEGLESAKAALSQALDCPQIEGENAIAREIGALENEVTSTQSRLRTRETELLDLLVTNESSFADTPIATPLKRLSGLLAEARSAMTDENETIASDREQSGFGYPRFRPNRAIAVCLVCVLVLGLFWLGKSLFPRSALTTEQIVAESEPSVALVKGRLSSGTGFLIAPKTLVTNKHVLESELIGAVKIHFPSASGSDRGPFDAELLYDDPIRDLAIVHVETTLKPIRLAENYQFRRGQEIIAIGNPGLGDIVLENAINKGVMSTETSIEGQAYYQLGISINPGNSGGPVLDSEGSVVGVLTLKASQNEGLAFCIPVADVRKTVAATKDMTADQIESTRSQHRARAVLKCITTIGEAYKGGMETYTDAMSYAISNRLSATDGLSAVQAKVQTRLAAYDKAIASDLGTEVPKIATDGNLSASVKSQFADLWTNYLALKSYVEDPRGTYSSYRAKLNELSDERDRLVGSLKLVLGATK